MPRFNVHLYPTVRVRVDAIDAVDHGAAPERARERHPRAASDQENFIESLCRQRRVPTVLYAGNSAPRLGVTEVRGRRQTCRFYLRAAIGETAARFAGRVGNARAGMFCCQPISRRLGARDRGDQQPSVWMLRRGHDRLDGSRLHDMGTV